MDNRITKKRLNDMLSYEWILIVAISVAIVIVWELIFSVLSVKLTVGQQFKCLYDYEVDYAGSEKLSKDLFEQDVLSPFVIESGREHLVNDDELINARLGTQDVDILFTSSAETDGYRRVNSYIDDFMYPVYSYEELLKDAKDYLKSFLEYDDLDATDFENLSEKKIEENFLIQYKKDNSYRTESQKQEGIKLEKERIKNLCKEVRDFETALEIGRERGIFYIYTRYEQLNRLEGGYDEFVEIEAKDQAFGLDMGKLSGGEVLPHSYAKLSGQTDATDTVLIVFNFKSYQPDLQYESISVINMIIRNCTDIL